MIQEQKRILIAEACGYEERGGGPEGIYYTHDDRDGEFLVDNLPDYFNDLNAMHEAEKVFDDGIDSAASLRYLYAGHLYNTVPANMQPFRATAAQRAEAFGRTLGLWT